MGIILKDWYGKDQKFDHDKIFVRDENGELVQFTQGTGEPNLQDKTITENGTFTADDGYDGLGSVTVDVKGAGGGSLPAGAYWKFDGTISLPNSNYQRWFMLNENLYALTLTATGKTGSNTVSIYKWSGSAWSLLTTTSSLGWYTSFYGMQYVEYNGKIHFAGNEIEGHFTFDEINGVVRKNDLPKAISGGLFVQDGKLKAYCVKDGSVYVWDESSDSWSKEVQLNTYAFYYYVFVNVGEEVYATYSNVLYKYENGVLTKVASASVAFDQACVVGNHVYCLTRSTNGGTLKKVNVSTGKVVTIGKTPPSTSGWNLDYILGEIRLIGCDNTYKCNYILHEVTE